MMGRAEKNAQKRHFAASIGQSQTSIATDACEAIREPTIGALWQRVERLREQVSYLNMLGADLTIIADSILGPVPTTDETDGVDHVPEGSINALDQQLSNLQMFIDDMSLQISRLRDL